MSDPITRKAAHKWGADGFPAVPAAAEPAATAKNPDIDVSRCLMALHPPEVHRV